MVGAHAVSDGEPGAFWWERLVLGCAVIITAVEMYKAHSTQIQRRPDFSSPSIHETAC